MSLDLGALVGHVVLETAAFDRAYTQTVRRMQQFGVQADKASSGVRVLDRTLISAAESADKASVGMDRAAKTTSAAAAAAEKNAAAQRQGAAAMTRVNAIMASVSGETTRVQQATLRLAVAQERLDALQQGGVATTRQLAAAQATLLGAQRGLTAAQEAGAVAGGRFRTSLASTLKMAGSLGVMLGAFELIKKGIDLTKQANEFQRSMVQIQTNADVTASEVTKASGALLKMSGDVATGPNDLAVAFYHAKSVGLDYAKALDTTKIAAQGAKVGHADLEETMNALTSTVASGIPGVKDMSSAMGQLIAIVGSGDMKLSDLNAAFSSGILTIVKGYGLSLTDVGAALATFGDNNIRGAEAATMLRMAVQAMAVPAKAGRDELDKLGLSTTQLRDDMQKGGLNKAILDLKAHLDAAHVGATQVGAVLTEVFGKRAGPGVAVLVGQVDRLQSKFKVLNDSGASFGDKWKATTQTASYAVSLLGAKAQSLAITLTGKLGPSIATAANWLGTTLPHAISQVQDMLGPLEHEVGTGLTVAWHGLAAVLGVAGTALGGVGSVLSAMSGPLTAVGTAALAMWAAFKGYGIAVVALRAVRSGLDGLALRAMYAKAAMMTINPLAVGASLGLVALAGAWQESAKEAAAAKERTAEYLGVLQQTKGAINDQVTAMLTQKLATNGVYDAARKYGIALDTVTQAALGNKDAIRQLLSETKGNMGATADVTNQVLVNTIALKQAGQQYKDSASQQQRLTGETVKHAAVIKQAATSLQWSIDAEGRLVESTAKAGSALDNTTAAMSRQTTASGILKNSLDYLNGVNATVEQTTDQLSIGLGNLRNKTALVKDANGHYVTSLNQSTVAGATNRQMLLGLIQNAKDQAQATADQAAKHHSLADALRIGNTQLGANDAAIRRAAAAAGLDKDQVDALISRLGHLANIKVDPTVNVNTADASTKLSNIHDILNNIPTTKTVDVYINTHTIGRIAKAAGGPIYGPGTGTSDSIPAMLSNGEYVINARQTAKHRALLGAINAGAAGYAAGGPVRGYASGGAVKTNYPGGTSIAGDALKLGKLGLSGTSAYGDVRSQLAQLERDLRAAGVPAAFITRLSRDNASILGAVSSRNFAASHLAKANQALVDARKVLAGDRSTFKGSVVGSFDITTAGVNSDTGQTTGGTALAGARQAVTRARAFVSGLTKLIHMKVFPGAYVRSLASNYGSNPEATLAEVQALLQLSPSQMKDLAAQNTELNKLGGQIAGTAAGRLDQHAVDVAAKNQRVWESRERSRQKHLEMANRKLAKDIGSQLHGLHLEGKLGLTAGQLYLIVETGKNQQRPRGKTSR